jgi:hypothetical protein
MEENYYKKYYIENKDEMSKKAKDWKIENKEKWNKYQNEWQKKKRREKKEAKGNG